ncbi:hypothetical protein [Virgibacillus salexigens]|uniref:hypothetical protein n=1 Tax=Virgibacillus massiliensis TaxID=1462526 RepID=UPI00136D6407|nr:hypothetical protein [Virgibacillus massiliensis]MYL42161.1 hypothetical protein [Virgibacillus massiliensis]
MSGKKVTSLIFILGILLGMFIIPSILSFFGIPTSGYLLASVFGKDNPLVLTILLLTICLVIFSVYKRPRM